MTASLQPGDSPSPLRLLVVDDDRRMRESLTRLLTREGFDVAEADGTDTALSLLIRDGEVPLIVTDLNMPGRDGRELLTAVRQRYPNVAVIMLTGAKDAESAVACLQLGARDYLTKPVQSQELAARVRKALADRAVAIEAQQIREAYVHDLEREVRTLADRNKSMFLAQTQMAVTMLEAKSPYTRGHSARVALFAVATAQKLGLPAKLVDEIRLGGELHDIGKIGTRDAVLDKPGPLTPEEFAEIRRHTIDGEAMLSVLRDEHPDVLGIVRSHHEHLDGTGFPDGLRGDAIPRAARIVSVADAFDAMTSVRTYGEQKPPDRAFAELRRVAGTQFDVDAVDAFISSYPEITLSGTARRH